MAGPFNVRVIAFRGIRQLPKVLPQEFSSDSVYQLEHPPEWSQTIIAGAAAVSTAPDTVHDRVRIIRIEVPDGEAIRYEINPPNRAGGVVAANSNSQRFYGSDEFPFYPGWSLSVIDASALP
jgi:hypothetical protein